jgi:hypothetical protein
MFEVALYSGLFFFITTISLLFKWLNVADSLKETNKLLILSKSHNSNLTTKNKGLQLANDKLSKSNCDLEAKLKEQAPDDITQQSIHELTHDLKTHGFMLMRVNPDHVFLRQ